MVLKTGSLREDIDALGWQFDLSYSQLPEYFYARVRPEAARDPALVLVNHRLAEHLGLHLSAASGQTLADVFSGGVLPFGADPIAQAYAGHQFGHFTMLGDGRAVLLGEQIAPTGVRYDIQFKGSGRTPFSRRGDGRAALGPMLREYLISEAMHGLGIPTTRSLAVASTGDWVYREGPEPGAVLTRVASSHLRVGTFQYAAGYQRHQSSSGPVPAVGALLRYAIARHDPALQQTQNPALEFLKSVAARQVSLLVHWMRVGFVHGVMNTDNMAISGETIDYGPCAFIDTYDPNAVFSSIDHAGRYAFSHQPTIAQWNLARLAESLLTEIAPDTDKALQLAGDVIEIFAHQYEEAWLQMMARKLGLMAQASLPSEDQALITDLLRWMQQAQADYTYTFWRLGQPDLTRVTVEDTGSVFYDSENRGSLWRDFLAPEQEPKFHQQDFVLWKTRWQQRLGVDPGALLLASKKMAAENPVVVPRNALVEDALRKVVQDGNLQPFESLLTQFASPYSLTDKSLDCVRPGSVIPNYRTFCGT
jgi:uncharacterized protein YdiU (UPF0061 family)